MTILLTGATGFLGSHLLAALINAGNLVVILKRSTSDTWRIQHLLHKTRSYDIDRQPMENAFQDQRIDAIIHTACHYGRKGEPQHEIVASNLLFSLELLDLATTFNTDAFFNTDTFFNNDTPLQQYLSAYTLSKKQFVEWLRHTCGKIKVVNLKLQHMYGPQDDETKFVHWIIGELQHCTDRIKLTPGAQLRDFIFIDDVVSAYLLTLQKISQLPAFSEFDVGTGILTSIKTLVTTIKALYETQHQPSATYLDFGALPYRAGEIMSVTVDNSALSKLGWTASTTLREGLVKTINSSL